MDVWVISTYIELYIWIILANSSNSNYESSDLQTELAKPTPLNFRIGVTIELRIGRTANQVTMVSRFASIEHVEDPNQ